MGWLGLTILCTLIALAFVHFKERAPLKMWPVISDYTMIPVVTMILSAIIIAGGGGMYSGIHEGHRNGDADMSGCDQWTNTWDIVSAVREKNSSSSFILGTGGSRTVDTYYVYRVDKEGLMLTNYNAHKTYVVERDGQPQYERIDYICKQPVYDFLWWSTGNTHRNTGKTGTLYVPLDTILRKFEM